MAVMVRPSGKTEDIEVLKVRAKAKLKADALALIEEIVEAEIEKLEWEKADVDHYDCDCCWYYPEGTLSLDLFLSIGEPSDEYPESVYQTISVHEDFGVFR